MGERVLKLDVGRNDASANFRFTLKTCGNMDHVDATPILG